MNGRALCVEVKGLAGAEIDVGLTPNEYNAMKRGGAVDSAWTLKVTHYSIAAIPVTQQGLRDAQ